MSFASLIYTDASREESIHFRTGFQFHAVSDDADQEDEALARHVLYVVPHSLVQRRLENEEFPQSFAYLAVEDRFIVARGRYLGRMADGRSGNQVTHCIVTHDANDFVSHLPAQLFGASVWRLQKSPTTTLPSLTAPLSVSDSFGLSALQYLVAASTAAVDALPSFLTMVEQASRRPRTRLVLLHTDLQVIAQWITVGTLFLDRDTALSTSFYAFSNRPVADARFDIVGTDPDLLEQPIPSDANWFDLRSFQGTAVETDEMAHVYARWFLQADPLQALRAVQVSRRWQSLLSSDVAVIAADRVVLNSRHVRSPAPASAAVLEALARHQHSADLSTFGPSLVDAVHEFDASDDATIELLLRAIVALHESGQNELMTGCTLAALEVSALSTVASSVWAQTFAVEGVPPTIDWPDQDARSHAARLLATIVDDSPDDVLSDMFSLARWLNTGLSHELMHSSIERLGQLWVSNPKLERQHTSWLHTECVRMAVCDTLSSRLYGTQRSEVVAQLRAGVWDWAANVPEVFTPDNPLFPWLLAGKLAKLDTPARRQEFERYVSHCAPTSWEAFFGFSNLLDIPLLDLWLRVHDKIEPSLAAVIEGIVTQRLTSSEDASCIVVLVDRLIDLRPDGLTETTTQLMSESEDFLRWSVEAVSVDHRQLRTNAPLERIASHCRRTIPLRYRTVAGLAIRCHDVETSARLFNLYHIDWRDPVLESLSDRLTIDPTDAVYVATLIWSHQGYAARLREAVARAVKDWWHNPRNRNAVMLVRESFNDSFYAEFGTMLKTVTPLRERLQRGNWRRARPRTGRDRSNG